MRKTLQGAAAAADGQDDEAHNRKKTRTYVRPHKKQYATVENVTTKCNILMQRGSHQYGLEVTLCFVLLLIIITIIKLFIILLVLFSIIINNDDYYHSKLFSIIQYY